MVEQERKMMRSFTIYPYAGIDEVKFGDTETVVEQTFGAPMRRSKNRKNETKFIYDDAEFTFSAGEKTLVEISFRPNVELTIGEVSIFHDKDTLEKLIKIEPPLEYVGILFFPIMGISTAGLHNADDVSVTAIAKGRFNNVLQKFVPYQ